LGKKGLPPNDMNKKSSERHGTGSTEGDFCSFLLGFKKGGERVIYDSEGKQVCTAEKECGNDKGSGPREAMK